MNYVHFALKRGVSPMWDITILTVTFLEVIMTGESTRTASQDRNHVMHPWLYQLLSEK